MTIKDYARFQSACRAEAQKRGLRLTVSSTNSNGNTRITLYDANGGIIRRESTGNRPTAQDKYDVLCRVAGEVFDTVSNQPTGPDTY